MNADELLTLLTELFFVLLSVVTIVDYLRHRDGVRRDVALMFGSLGLPFLVQVVGLISKQPTAQWVTVVSSMALIAEPYLLLRLVQYLDPTTPQTILRVAIVGMILSWIAIFVAPTPAPPIVAIAVIAYFVGIDGYAMIAFVRGAQRTTGVSRQRLSFGAAGSGLFALTLLIAGLASIPALKGITELVLVALVASAITFYVGFAPPRWLRRAWQFGELSDYLARISSKSSGERFNITESMTELCHTANRAVGGVASGIAQRDDTDQKWMVRFQVGDDMPELLNDGGIIRQTYQSGTPGFLRATRQSSVLDHELLKSVGADTLLVVPIVTSERTWGLLLVFLKYNSLFIDDDLNLITLLVRQSAMFLENISLVEQLRSYSEDLEKMVLERTKELSQSEVRFRSIFEQAAVGIVEMSIKGKFLQINQRFCDIVGYSADELLQLTREQITHPDDIKADYDNINNLVAQEISNYSIEKRYFHKMGDIVWVNVTTSLVQESTEESQHLVLIVEDITEQKKAEKALQESEGRYQLTLDNMMEGCQIIGFDWNYLYVNDAATRYGRMTREELIGHTVMEKYPGIETSEMFAAMQQCMKERIPKMQEFEFTYGDSRQAWFEFSIQPVPEGIFILSLDITERKEAEKALQSMNEELEKRVNERTIQLQATNKELEAFSYSVSHDLRAPLRALDGFSQALEEDYGDVIEDEGKKYLARIRAGSQRMGQLIDDLLDLSRLTRNEMRHESVDLSGLVREIAAELREQYPGCQVEFEAEDGLVVNGDEKLLRAALSNLLNNAWKYTGKQPKPKVMFGTTEHDGTCTYFVRDNGVGFDMTYAHKLFGVFQRLHSTDEFPGNGIGLATVQRVINRHGGHIWAESTLNEGATFYFTL